VSALTDYYSSGINLNGGQFGAYRTPTRRHRGQDISHSSKPGTVGVPALHAGRVVGKTVPSSFHGFGYGITVRSVLDGMEFDISYSHGPWASQQQIGEWIPQGKIILHEGNSGATQGSCVHIEQQRVGGGFLDPLPEIRRVAGGRVTSAPAPAAPTPAPAPSGDAPPAGEFNPFGIRWSKGLQKIARLYGYRGPIDAKFAGGSMAGFAEFLRKNWGYRGNDQLGPVMWSAIARWLRARWGYVGNDTPGPVMRAALSRAEAENYKAL
jgi:hypothetical protein